MNKRFMYPSSKEGCIKINYHWELKIFDPFFEADCIKSNYYWEFKIFAKTGYINFKFALCMENLYTPPPRKSE